MQNIFVYEAIEVTKHDGITIVVHQMVIRVCEMLTEKIQNVAVMMYVRFKVTICLYLIPNHRARSRSTLMAVNVSKDTPHNA